MKRTAAGKEEKKTEPKRYPEGINKQRRKRSHTSRHAGRTKERNKQASAIYHLLKKAYPDARCGINFKTPFELLAGAILSAQTTDRTVNRVLPVLLKIAPTPEKLASLDIKTIEDIIHPTGFYHVKAGYLKKTAAILSEKYHGEIPKTMEELITLPGVARKTANVVLSSAFNINEGIACDTHVIRVSSRLGLSKGKNAVQVEKDLMELFPRKNWGMVSHLLITHGRRVCHARNPECSHCIVSMLCPLCPRMASPSYNSQQQPIQTANNHSQ